MYDKDQMFAFFSSRSLFLFGTAMFIFVCVYVVLLRGKTYSHKLPLGVCVYARKEKKVDK